MTREEFIVAAEIAFERLMTPTRGLPPELMEEPMAEGERSFKDLAAQFIFWNELTVRALEELNYDREFDWSLYESDSNTEALKRLKPQSVKRVLTELRLTHTAMMEALRRIPEDKLLFNGKIPKWLIEHMVKRYESFIPQIEAWAERIRSEGRALPPLQILGGS